MHLRNGIIYHIALDRDFIPTHKSCILMKQDYFVYQVSYFKSLLVRLENFGIDIERCIQKSEIRHFDLSNSQNYIPTTVVHDLFSVLRKDSGSDALISNLLKDFSLSELGSYGLYLSGFSTLDQAITAFTTSKYALQTNIQTTVTLQKDEVVYTFSFLDQHAKGGQLSEYIMVAIVCQLFNVYLGHHWTPIAVHTPNATILAIEPLLPSGAYHIQHHQAAYRFVFPKSVVQYGTKDRFPTVEITPAYPEKKILEIIENVISSYNYGCIPSLSMLAGHFNTSESSLKRILKSKQAKFSTMLGHILHDRAVELLTTSDMNINSISEHLGYSDSPNFIRSFKKWTGLTPGMYRDSLSV